MRNKPGRATDTSILLPMRTFIIVSCMAFLLAACSSPGPKKAAVKLTRIELDVTGMTCEGCEKAIVASVSKLEGIGEATASHTDGKVIVAYDSTRTNLDAISTAIADAGYSVE
jgi:copper chaperone